MVDFNRNYDPPGVYVDEVGSNTVAVDGIAPSVPVVVGLSRGYEVFAEQFPFSTSAVRLSKKNVDLASIKIQISSTRSEVPATEYTATVTADDWTDIAATDYDTVAEGTKVLVTYNHLPEDYFLPRRFTVFEDVRQVYGEPLNTAPLSLGQTDYDFIPSPVSLAAQVLFQNGAEEIYVCPVEPLPDGTDTPAAISSALRTGLNQAYGRILPYSEINVVVPVTEGIVEGDASGVLVDFSSWLTASASSNYLRFGLIGFDAAVTSEPDALLSSSGVENSRLSLVYRAPSALQMYSGSASAAFQVGHGFLAAAIAGRMVSQPVQQSMTRQQVSGFVRPTGSPIPESLKDQYAASGVTVVEYDRNSRLVVRHSLSTKVTSVNDREVSVVRAKDAMVTSVRNGMLDSGLLGEPINEDLILSVKSTMQGLLDEVEGDGVILGYTELAVRQASTNPSVVEIKFSYRPAYPLNYVSIVFSIDTATGATQELDAA